MCSIIKLATIAFDETSSYWSAPKSFYFIGFSLVATQLSDYHWSAFRNHEGSTFTEKDRNKLNWTKAELITSYCSYARSAQPGPIRTRLCGPCIAAKAGSLTRLVEINIFFFYSAVTSISLTSELQTAIMLFNFQQWAVDIYIVIRLILHLIWRVRSILICDCKLCFVIIVLPTCGAMARVT